MPIYSVTIPAYSQTIKAKNEQKAIEQFNESIDMLHDINDEMLNIKIKEIKCPHSNCDDDAVCIKCGKQQ